MKKRNRVLVGMSGGVDSSVAAFLLKQKGFDVSGCFMVFEAKGNRCCSLEARNRAREVAGMMKIPFYSFDFKKEFKEKIISGFVDGYQRGITPNPCVECNKEIKFGVFLEKALALDFDYVATGHYARLQHTKLLKGKDRNKDQSYFLWRLNQDKIKRTIFPLGDYTKNQVRELARKFKLSTAEVEESQEVCFVKKTTNDFLRKNLGEKRGEIINIKGEKIGKHQGLHFYTIGQRKGLGLSNGPYFVVKKDIKKNVLIVSRDEKNLLSKELIVGNLNWINPRFPLRVSVKIRYNQKPVLGRIEKKGKLCRVVFDKAQRAVTPGQSAVFYKKNELLGGGVIR